MGLFDGLKEKLAKTRKGFAARINDVVKNFRTVDEDFFEEMEEILILSDIGAEVTKKILDELRAVVKEKNIQDTDAIKTELTEILKNLMTAPPLNITYPAVVLVVGVNGVGKTTAIGKLSKYYQDQGAGVMLAAADTFRAAAAEQLSIWGKRTNARVIKYAEGADPAAVVYDAIDAAKHANTDILMIDTAGRLHNKKNLMSELDKINRVIEKEYPAAQRETWLVVDATTGQNAIIQAQTFAEVTPVTGVILTKMDGTAKGGIAVAIQAELGIPVKYIGVGETIDDLQKFNSDTFVNALFNVKGEHEVC